MRKQAVRQKIGLCILLAATVAVAAVFSAVSAGENEDLPAANPDKPDHFPLKSGLTWKYKSNLGETITRVTKEGDEYHLVSQAPHVTLQQHLTVTVDGVVLTWGESEIYFFSTKRTYHPPLLRLPLPVRIGRHWIWEGTELVDGELLHSRVEGTVEGEEKIRVPAGEFTCLKVKVRTISDDGTVSSSTQWLAPGVGVVKAFIGIEAGGLTGVITWLLGLDTFSLELEEISE